MLPRGDWRGGAEQEARGMQERWRRLASPRRANEAVGSGGAVAALPTLISTFQQSEAYSNCVTGLLLEIASAPNMHFYINKGTKWPFRSLCNVFFNGRS